MRTIVCLLFCLLFSNVVVGEIQVIHQMSGIEDVIGPLTDSEWILLDIDYTLTEPTLPALQMSVIKQNKQLFRDEIAKFSEEQKLLVPVLMVTQVANQLTDPSIPQLIQKWQKQNIPILGFTAIDTASIPGVGSIPAWRAKELKRLGISFHPSRGSPFPQEREEFKEFSSFRGTFPLYDEGIIYCNVTASKGAVLGAFLKGISKKPSRIIFVDDSLENLQSAEAEMKQYGIPFLGIHYKVQLDESKIPKVSDEEWRSVWDQIEARANEIRR